MSSKQISRRKFIHNGLVVGEAAALAMWGGQHVLAEGQPLITEKPKEGKTYKLGIIGCGNRSKFHINCLNHISEIQISALCDIVPHKMDQRAELIEKGPVPRKYTEIEKMLDQQDLDAVAVVLPNHLHKMATIAALEAGKHVLCEKPMALTVADCNEMIAVSKQKRKAIQIGTQRRHSECWKTVVQTIRNASLGLILSSDINSCRGDWRFPEPDEYPSGVPYWRMDQAKCGGVVYEMGAHTIDVNNWIFDSEPVTVVSLQGVNDHALRPRDSYDHAGVLVRYANDALMNFDGNLYNYGPAPSNQFYYVNGTVWLEDDKKLEIRYAKLRSTDSSKPKLSRDDGTVDQYTQFKKELASQKPLHEPINLELTPDNGTTNQWAHFAKVLAGQADPYPNGYTGRQSIQICQGAVVSAKEKTIVNVKDLDSV